MKIRVPDIPREGSHVEFELDREAVAKRAGSQVRFPENPRSELDVSVDNRTVRLQGQVAAVLVSQCARCAEDAESRLQAKVDMLLKPEAEKQRGETEDVDFGYYSGEEVNCDEVAEEALMLAIPYVVLCRSDCRGLCSSCGRNLNTDPCSCSKERGLESPFSILKDIKIV